MYLVLDRKGIRMHVIGDPSRLPESLQRAAREAEETTRNNPDAGDLLRRAVGDRAGVPGARPESAGGRRRLLRPEDIDEALLAGELQTSAAAGEELSCPDLVIRTSSEMRLSNFVLLWQSAYSELYFTDTLWPDFGEAEYLRALTGFCRVTCLTLCAWGLCYNS
jgi:ditrans,polycis-polyprenyl diphosphate synthase